MFVFILELLLVQSWHNDIPCHLNAFKDITLAEIIEKEKTILASHISECHSIEFYTTATLT